MNLRKVFFSFLTLFSIVGYGVFVFAAPSIVYQPGQVLNPGPGCYPGSDCVVDLSGTGGGVVIGDPVVSGVPGQVIYADAGGNVFGDDDFVRDASSHTTYLLAGNAGLNFDSSGTQLGYINNGPGGTVARLRSTDAGNTLIWNPDTSGTITDTIEQGQNLFGFGASGNLISHADSSIQQTSFMGIGNFMPLGVPVSHGSMLGDINFNSGDISQVFTGSGVLTGLLLKDSVLNPLSSTYESAVNLAPTYLNIDYKFGVGTPNHYLVGLNNTGVVIGDSDGTVHGTYIQVDDTNSAIVNHTDGLFSVSNADGSADFFITNAADGYYFWGDLNSTLHGTMLAINDNDQAITFNFDGDFYSFPTGDGSSGQVMATDGNGQLSWVNQSGGGGGSPAGADTEIQFNDNGSFGSNSAFKFSGAGTTNILNILGPGNSGNNTGKLVLGSSGIDMHDTNGFSVFISKALGSTYSFVLPGSQGSSGQTLINDGSGNLSWNTPTGDGCGAESCFTIDGSSNMYTGTNAGAMLSLGSNNFFAGIDTGRNVSISNDNTFIGNLAGRNLVLSDQVAIGYAALVGDADTSQNTGGNNVAVGTFAGVSNTSGNTNVFMGNNAGYSNTSGSEGTFIGMAAGTNNTTGSFNTYIGRSAGYFIGTGESNVAVGNNALRGSLTIGDNTGRYNTSIGTSSGFSNKNGEKNLFAGFSAGYTNASGSENTALGYASLYSNQTGNNNIAIGHNAFINNLSGSSNLIIGEGAADTGTTGNYNIVLGAFADVATSSTTNAIALGASAVAAANQFVVGADVHPIEEMVINGATETCTIRPDTAGIACTSDEQLKTNITDLDNVLGVLSQVRTVTYDWESKPGQGRHIGFLAQNLQQSFPELVSVGPRGYLQVSYAGITPVLVQGINELHLKITDIENFASAENKTFLNSLITWLGDAMNGLMKVHVGQELCIGNTCINESDLQSFKNWQAGVSQGFGYGYGN